MSKRFIFLPPPEYSKQWSRTQFINNFFWLCLFPVACAYLLILFDITYHMKNFKVAFKKIYFPWLTFQVIQLLTHARWRSVIRWLMDHLGWCGFLGSQNAPAAASCPRASSQKKISQCCAFACVFISLFINIKWVVETHSIVQLMWQQHNDHDDNDDVDVYTAILPGSRNAYEYGAKMAHRKVPLKML